MTTQKIEDEFVEKGADLEHDRWARWQKYMFSKMNYTEYEKDGRKIACYILPADLWERWSRQIDTPYSELSEEEKESDRKETRNYLPLLTQALSQREEEVKGEIVKEAVEAVRKCPSPNTGKPQGNNVAENLRQSRLINRGDAMDAIEAL